jgi:hypothetical protein
LNLHLGVGRSMKARLAIVLIAAAIVVVFKTSSES